MNWFEGRPLLGKRIVITRAREQASDLVQRLSDLGAECIEQPTIKTEPIKDMSQMDRAIENLSSSALDILLDVMNRFQGIVSIEVFSFDQLAKSLYVFDVLILKFH